MLATAHIQSMVNWAAPLADVQPKADELGRQIYRKGEPAVRTALAYSIGITGSFWAIERIAATFF